MNASDPAIWFLLISLVILVVILVAVTGASNLLGTRPDIPAITDAAHDTVHKPSIISISWGGPESSWRKSDRLAMSNAIRDAGLMGVTVTVAAGDNGSADGLTDRKSHVDFPASSPYSLACGGTHNLRRDDLPDQLRFAQTLQAGRGKNDGVVFSLFEFAQARVDVSA